MKKIKKKGFTLIELIAVLVIMAIIALIATPLVMSIIRKARVSADKRSVDAYGRSIELAIAGYLLDNGKFPTEVSQLTIEYSGNEVVCETTQINTDSSVYLAECKVNGRSVEGYTYGKNKKTYTEYSVGDYVLYNNIGYFVLEDSDSTNDTVKLLKETPLTYREMGIAESDDYGSIGFGESTDYNQSTVKQKVDAWASTAIKEGDSATARLIKVEDLTDSLGYEYFESVCGEAYKATEKTPSWVHNENYWTMSQFDDSYNMWIISYEILTGSAISNDYYIRPVLELKKSADINIVSYEAYKIGDKVSYNDEDYYVIKDTETIEENVTLLKAEPLSISEVNTYGVGHINRYIYTGGGFQRNTAANIGNGYGGMAYYSSETCGYYGTDVVKTGCTTDYAQSEVKYVVDAWKSAKAPDAKEARLITYEELINQLGCTDNDCRNYSWLYNSNYWYWTMSPWDVSSSRVWGVGSRGSLGPHSVNYDTVNSFSGVVRPVITISKSNISNTGN